MNLCIEQNGKLRLEEHLDFKKFAIVDTFNQIEGSKDFAAISESCQDNHYWIDANAVIDLCSEKDEQWVENFWNMLRAVEAYGYSDVKAGKIKAHVSTASD